MAFDPIFIHRSHAYHISSSCVQALVAMIENLSRADLQRHLVRLITTAVRIQSVSGSVGADFAFRLKVKTETELHFRFDGSQRPPRHG